MVTSLVFQINLWFNQCFIFGFPKVKGHEQSWTLFAFVLHSTIPGFLSRGRRPPGSCEQSFLRSSSAVMLQNPSVTILIIRQF